MCVITTGFDLNKKKKKIVIKYWNNGGFFFTIDIWPFCRRSFQNDYFPFNKLESYVYIEYNAISSQIVRR